MSNLIPFANSFCAVSKAPSVKIKKEDFNYSSDLQLNDNWRNIANGTSTYMRWTEDHDK